MENAEIKKSDNNKIITITKGGNSLRLELNEEENRVILDLINGKTHNYILKLEDGKLNVYKKENRRRIQELLEKTMKYSLSISKKLVEMGAV